MVQVCLVKPKRMAMAVKSRFVLIFTTVRTIQFFKEITVLSLVKNTSMSLTHSTNAVSYTHLTLPTKRIV